MPEIKTDKPKLTWIDIAITVTLLASIVGLAAWLLSGKFSYVAAPASSFGLVNLLKKPKEEDDIPAEASEPTPDRPATVIPTRPDPLEGTDVYRPPTLLDTVPARLDDLSDDLPSNVPEDLPEDDDPGQAEADLMGQHTDPFDGSLLEIAPVVSESLPTEQETIDPTPPSDQPDPIPTPPDLTGSSLTPSRAPIDQPIRYLSERYEQGERNFQNFDLRHVDLNYRSLHLIGADLRELKAERANLRQIDLTQANLGRADLRYAQLDGANLSYTNLAAANLCGASLRGVNLRDAKLMDAQLAIADLSYADLSGADLSGADLTDTNLYRARLDGTTLPETLQRA